MNSNTLEMLLRAAEVKAKELGATRVTIDHVVHAWLSMDREGTLAKAMRERGVTPEVVARVCRFADAAMDERLRVLPYPEKVAMHRRLGELLAQQDVGGTGC
jgi:hypothetical protein